VQKRAGARCSLVIPCARATFQAAERGASLLSIAAHADHKKIDTTRGYVQIADVRDHSGKGFLQKGNAK
jgi:hypothetical protein